MGIPGLSVSLYHKYKNNGLIVGYDNRPVNALYLDANCLIHPVCMKVYSEASKNENLDMTNHIHVERLEAKMIRAVIEYIEMLISLSHPQQLVYIAVDGVAPMAKIKHQRTRRFKSAKDYEIKNDIAKKHSVKYPKPWSNSAITPGTVFMTKLTQAILIHLQGKQKSQSTPVEYIFSSCNTPSEGEHKIVQHIKKHHIDGTKMIYGLDADLVYLALVCNKTDVCLLRETSEFQRGVTEGFSILNIDCLRDCITMEINKKVDQERFIRDYIFMGFFLGNDFIPQSPSINFQFTKETLNGHSILLECYNSIFNGDYLLNDDFKINKKMLLLLLEKLSAREEPYFREAAKQRMYPRQCESQNAYDIEIHRLENMMFKIPDPIERGKENISYQVSRERYYKYYEIEPINAVEKYLEGIQWTLRYYFDKCPDWLWFYPYEVAPYIKDVYTYLLNNEIKEPNFINGIKFIKPLQQLLMVLPTQSRYFLPKSYQMIMQNELKEYYPERYELDFVMKTRYWQGVPKVPMINPWNVVELTQNIKLTDEEEARNIFRLEFKIII
jgi:5'-3' exonuclease